MSGRTPSILSHPFFLLVLIVVPLCLLLRIYAVLPSTRERKAAKRSSSSPTSTPTPTPTSRAGPSKTQPQTQSIAIFMGSGGHTAEMTTLALSLDFTRYTPRKWIVCEGDEMSLRAIARIEGEKGSGGASNQNYTILSLPRARRVAQPPLSTLFSTLRTLLYTTHHLFLDPTLLSPFRPYADILLINGPGTCVVLCLVSYIRRVLGMRFTKIIYVESFARVKSLSLSGKLLRRVVDVFVVQWPEAGGKGRKVYKGWLV